MLGPFSIEISDQAERLDFEALPDKVQEALCSGHSYKPSTHDIYRFHAAPRCKEAEHFSRKEKKQSYEKTDRALVQVDRGHDRIMFLGMYPNNIKSSGQLELELETEALFELTIPKIFKARLKGRAKGLVRRKKHSVLAHRTDTFLQWIFLNEYVDDARPLGFSVFCSVPKNISEEERFILCRVSFWDKGRKVEKAQRVVTMPEPLNGA